MSLPKDKQTLKSFDESQADVIRNMIHDLRVPLNAILGSAQILNIHDHYPDQQEFIDAIFHAGQALLNLVEDLKTLSDEYNSNVLLGSLEVFELQALLDEVVNIMSHQAKQKDLFLHVDYDDALPEKIENSPSYIRRILFNLLSNAIKFTTRGGVNLRVGLDLGGASTMLKITIQDTGQGIDRSLQEKIFERGVQATAYPQGAGLGLYIVQKLLKQLGGDIRVDSQPGFGSTFECFMPLNISPAVEPWHQLERLIYSGVGILMISTDSAVYKQFQEIFPKIKRIDPSASDDIFSSLTHLQETYQIILIDTSSGIDMQAYCQAISRNEWLQNLFWVELSASPSEMNHSIFHLQVFKQEHALTNLVKVQQIWTDWLKGKAQENLKQNHTIRVLLVENDPASQQIAQAMLESLECTVDIASSKAEALKCFEGKQYDLIFVDIGLGDGSGFEVAEDIRAREKGHNPVPLVALTAHALEDYGRKSLQAGMNAFMTKPVLYDDFQRVLRKFIYTS